MQAAAAGGAQHAAGGADDEGVAGDERAVDGAGDLGFVNFDFAFEHAAMGDGEFDEAVDHGGFDGTFDDQAFGVLHGALNADAAADDQRAALALFARGRGRLRGHRRADAGGEGGRGDRRRGERRAGHGGLLEAWGEGWRGAGFSRGRVSGGGDGFFSR